MKSINILSISFLGVFLSLILLSGFIPISFEASIGSPKHQLESGIAPENIVCKSVHVLLLKISNGFPACVTKLTADKLMDRGWNEIKNIYIEPPSLELPTFTDPEDISTADIINANNGFAFEFYSQIKDDKENIFFLLGVL